LYFERIRLILGLKNRRARISDLGAIRDTDEKKPAGKMTQDINTCSAWKGAI
jgi:hypothetical protein